MTVVTNGFAIVPAPPALPPRVGLIPSLQGTPYLDPPDRWPDANQPAAEPVRPLPPGAMEPAPGGGPIPAGSEPRWQAGLQYAPEQACSTGGYTDPCAPADLVAAANQGNVAAMPGLVWTADRCSTLGWQARDYYGRVTRSLIACESKQIARELWKGTQAQVSGWPNRFLASPLSDTLSPANTAVSPTQALQCLEQGLADCGCGARGMIHCTRELLTTWGTLNAGGLRREGGLILTIHDTIIVPDAGYDGSGPYGEPAINGSQWAYATGMVTVRRSAIDVVPGTYEEAVIAGTNSLEFRAERLAVATFEPCCHLAIEVNLPLCLEGGAS